jgi:hypothetical protein
MVIDPEVGEGPDCDPGTSRFEPGRSPFSQTLCCLSLRVSIEHAMTKRCPGCGQHKPATEFARNRAKKDGLASHCKPCKKNIQDRWYQEHREEHLSRVYAWKERYRFEVTNRIVEYLRSHPCADCGEQDPLVLDFDHVSGEKEGDICAMICERKLSWAVIEAEIAKCAVRCANCHRRKTARERGTVRYSILYGTEAQVGSST